MTIGLKLTIFSLLTFAITPPAFSQESEDASPQKEETKFQEVITTDSLPPGELLKRATNWAKEKSKVYVKSAAANSGNKVECVASFTVRPKELNPRTDYTGKFTMNVSIECKDNRYRYTVSQIKHLSKSGQASGGSIDNRVPECGSVVMEEMQWKKLKGEAIKHVNQVVADLKESMGKEVAETKKDDEW